MTPEEQIIEIKNAIQLLKRSSKTDNTEINSLLFTEGVNEIELYGFNLWDVKKRRYLIELHKCNGFAMIKFYPKTLSKNKKKYELRGVSQIGFSLKKASVIKILLACAILMKEYLDKNSENFVGYVGQTDDKDNNRKKPRDFSQRSMIYNLLLASVFTPHKYKLSSRRTFEEVNLRLVRKVISRQEGKVTSKQMENYQSFMQLFIHHKDQHLSMMTEKTRKKYLRGSAS